MKIFFKEPLVIFLLLGAGLFYLFQSVNNEVFSENPEIVITSGHIQALSQGFKKVWQRSPTEQELDGLIQNYIRQEILYREALAMGLDKDDSVVRRRMSQKIAFIFEDISSLEEPTNDDLQVYLNAHKENYLKPARYSFTQIYFDVGKRGEKARADALAALRELKNQGVEDTALGDSLMLKRKFNRETERELERLLGAEFTQSLREAPVGDWYGPLKSGFGLHLVYITERQKGEVFTLDEVRPQLVRDWFAAKREQSNEAFYQNLRKRYNVTIQTQ